MGNTFRKAGERISMFNSGGQPTSQAQEVLRTVADRAGQTKLPTVEHTPKELHASGVLGYVDWTKPGKIFMDPKQGDLHTLAHEGIHSMMPTALGTTQMTNRIATEGSDFSRSDVPVSHVPREGGNRLRYMHEKMAVPTMLEESAAQGGAQGVMDKMGLKNQDRGFRVRYGDDMVFNDDVYRHKDGSVDQLAYPLMYRDKAVHQYTQDYGGTFEGKPLGMGIDPRFSDAEREVYYDIGDHSRSRAERVFNEYRNKFK